MPTDKGNPTSAERDERFKIESADGTDIDPLAFLAGLLEVDPETPAAHADPSHDQPGGNMLASEDDDE